MKAGAEGDGVSYLAAAGPGERSLLELPFALPEGRACGGRGRAGAGTASTSAAAQDTAGARQRSDVRARQWPGGRPGPPTSHRRWHRLRPRRVRADAAIAPAAVVRLRAGAEGPMAALERETQLRLPPRPAPSGAARSGAGRPGAHHARRPGGAARAQLPAP